MSMKRQVQSLADDGERNNAKKRCQDHQPTVQAIAKERVGCGAFENPAIGAAGQDKTEKYEHIYMAQHHDWDADCRI